MNAASRRPLCLCLLLAALPGCGDDDGGGNQNHACPEGHAPRGPACVPVFDLCPGEAEVPVLGGGCRAAGVTTCATGLVPDGTGGCDAVLPDAPCLPGTMEVLGETTCQPVGVTACATGFAPDGSGGCDAVLPDAPCPSGTLEVLGETTCQPLSDCGAGPWGLIDIDETTVFVDAAAEATGADGTEAHPFPSLEDGVAAAPDDGQVAIAAGEYPVRLRIDRPVRLAGRCAASVTLRGRLDEGAVRAPVTLHAGSSGTTVQGVTLTGEATGIQLSDAVDVAVQDVQIVDTGGPGLLAVRSGFTLDRVLVARATEFAVVSTAGDARITRSALRETRAAASGVRGYGLGATCDGTGPASSRVALDGCVIADNHAAGVVVFGTDLTLTGTVIRGTGSGAGGAKGRGLEAICDDEGTGCGQVIVSGSLIAETRDIGLSLFGVDAVVSDTVIRDTAPEETGAQGLGLHAECDVALATCPGLDLRSSVISGNTGIGVSLLGARARVVGTVIRDTAPGTGYGRGLEAACPEATLTCEPLEVTRSLVSGNATSGIGVRSVPTTITDTVIRDTVPRDPGLGGRGIEAACDPRFTGCGALTVRGALIAGNREFGILLQGPAATITGTVIQDTLPDGSGLLGRGLEARCEPDRPTCGAVELRGSLIARNQEAGVAFWGVPALVRDTVVRDTAPSPGEGVGHGLTVLCDPLARTCGELVMSGCLIERSTEVGVLLKGAAAAITDTVIRETRPDATGESGRGLEAQCSPDPPVCGPLELVDSLISGSTDLGVYLLGAPGRLVGTTVRDMQPATAGGVQPESGQGILVRCDPDGGGCGSLEMTAGVVRSTYTAGLALLGVSGVVTSSEVTQVLPHPASLRFGYGIETSSVPGDDPPVLDVRRCLIQAVDLAGLVYSGAGGSVTGCAIGGGDFSIAVSPGYGPTIAADNLLEGSVSSQPARVSLASSPTPPPTVP